MDKRVKDLWVAALRSGNYRQTTLAKIRLTGCCGRVFYSPLGVLCEIALQERVISEYYGVFANPPYKVQQWASIDEDPVLGKQRLSALSEGGLTFQQIADRIERYL